MNSELNTYKNAAVGMRVAVTAAGPSAPAAGPVTWFGRVSRNTPASGRVPSPRRRTSTNQGGGHAFFCGAASDREGAALDSV